MADRRADHYATRFTKPRNMFKTSNNKLGRGGTFNESEERRAPVERPFRLTTLPRNGSGRPDHGRCRQKILIAKIDKFKAITNVSGRCGLFNILDNQQRLLGHYNLLLKCYKKYHYSVCNTLS